MVAFAERRSEAGNPLSLWNDIGVIPEILIVSYLFPLEIVIRAVRNLPRERRGWQIFRRCDDAPAWN